MPIILAAMVALSLLRMVLVCAGVLGANNIAEDYEERRRNLTKRVKELREKYPVVWGGDKPAITKKADDPTSKVKVADSKPKQDWLR